MASNPGNLNLSITRENAKIYIARILGGAISDQVLAMAEESLLKGFNDWQAEKDWEFLLKDDISSFTVESCSTTNLSAVISAPVASSFDGINIGISVSGTNIPASTTISSYTRNADGTIATITLSNAATGTAVGTVTLTFGGTIPIIAGVSDYNLPTDFHKHYGVRLTSNLKWPLTFIRLRDWNRVTLDQTITGPPDAYTIYNATSPLSQNKGTFRIRLFRVPSTNDILKVEYYRKFSALADPIDMHGEYLYKFLDFCRAILISTKRAFDEPELFASMVHDNVEKAKQNDEAVTEDEDVRMKSQMEMGINVKPTYSNGPFWPDYGY